LISRTISSVSNFSDFDVSASNELGESQMKSCQVLILFLCALTLTTALVSLCFAADAVEATGKIDDAESNLNSAFEAVYQAQNAGADIRDLVVRLGTAGDLLSKAYAEFRVGDYESAATLATDCSHTVEGIASEAIELRAKTEIEKSDRMLLTFAGSGIGLAFLLVSGITGWRFLKKRYWKRVYEMRPEA